MLNLRTALVVASMAVLSSAFAGGDSLPGTWMVLKNGRPNPMMKLIFSPKGQFKFAGANYSSGGNYVVTGNTIRLLWTMVDGQKVKQGSMKKDLYLTPENTFTIDQYTYGKAR